MIVVSVVPRIARASARRTITDRPALVVTGLFYLLVTAVLSGLWSVAADANGGSVAGYSAVAIVWYIATTESGTISVPMRLIEDVGDDIASGSVVSEMLRPMPMLWVRVAGEVGRCLPRLALCATIGGVFATLVAGAPPNAFLLPLAAVSLILAVTLNVVAQHLFAAAAFWIRDAKSAWFLYQKLVFILGGMLLPIEVLPDRIEAVARWLPFIAMAYAPARIASGHTEPELLLVQVGWILVIALFANAAFRRGERLVTESGA